MTSRPGTLPLERDKANAITRRWRWSFQGRYGDVSRLWEQKHKPLSRRLGRTDTRRTDGRGRPVTAAEERSSLRSPARSCAEQRLSGDVSPAQSYPVTPRRCLPLGATVPPGDAGLASRGRADRCLGGPGATVPLGDAGLASCRRADRCLGGPVSPCPFPVWCTPRR